MAKATITTTDGTSIKIDGTPEEIAVLLGKLKVKPSQTAKPTGRAKSTSHPQLIDLIGSLIDGGFFQKPKDLASVKSALAQMGHHYPLTTLSPSLLRQVRRRNLRRVKQDNRWFYTR